MGSVPSVLARINLKGTNILDVVRAQGCQMAGLGMRIRGLISSSCNVVHPEFRSPIERVAEGTNMCHFSVQGSDLYIANFHIS